MTYLKISFAALVVVDNHTITGANFQWMRPVSYRADRTQVDTFELNPASLRYMPAWNVARHRQSERITYELVYFKSYDYHEYYLWNN